MRAAGAIAVTLVAVAVGWALARGEDHSTWGHLTWQTPKGWSVRDADLGACHIPPAGLAPGPFIGTVDTGSMYRQTATGWECGRNLAVSDAPADGVVAWVSAQSVPSRGSPAPDPGASTAGLCGGAAGGHAFHTFRILTGPTEQMRVALDGCVFGREAGIYLQQLDALSASFRYQ